MHIDWVQNKNESDSDVSLITIPANRIAFAMDIKHIYTRISVNPLRFSLKSTFDLQTA